jgi:hypothetical protein
MDCIGGKYKKNIFTYFGLGYGHHAGNPILAIPNLGPLESRQNHPLAAN